MRHRLPITIIYVGSMYGVFPQYAIGSCHINYLTYNVR